MTSSMRSGEAVAGIRAARPSPRMLIMDVFCSTHGHNDLRLDRAVLEGSDNGVLHLDLGASARADGTRIGDRDVAVDVDGLVRNATKLPGRTPPSAGMKRPPEAASKIVTLRISPTPKVMSRGR